MKFCPDCQKCFSDEIRVCSEKEHGTLQEGRFGLREIFANYRLDFLQESTEFGETYLAFNKGLGKNILIKIFNSEVFGEDAKLCEAFLRETQDLSVINHPNVVRVFERGMLADGSVYVVTEHLEGQTLRETLNNEGVNEINALAIAGQVAEGLNVLHTLDILHRNIRPENIILSFDKKNRLLAKIQNIDFAGIQQKIISLQNDEKLSALTYFSPEQCVGKTIDEQTDVYALGVVLYEMISRKIPFDAPDTESLINQKNEGNPPPVHIENFNIRALFNHTLLDSLQKTKRLRLKNINVFARRLRYIEQIATHSNTPQPAISYPNLKNQMLLTKNEIPDEILADLPTEELPELEAVVGEFLFENNPEAEQTQTLKTNNLTFIEWEQPDDIPLLTKIIEGNEATSEPEFIFSETVNPVFNSPKVLLEKVEYSTKKRFFTGILWKPKVLLAAAFALLIVLAFGANFMNRQFQMINQAEKNVVQILPVEKPMQSEKVLGETEKNEEQTANNTSAENLELPDYQPRYNEENKSVAIAKRSPKKQTPKTNLANCNCDKTIQSKPVANQTPERKVIVVGSSKPLANDIKSIELSVFNRPRVVKNPKL